VNDKEIRKIIISKLIFLCVMTLVYLILQTVTVVHVFNMVIGGVILSAIMICVIMVRRRW